MVMEQAAKMGHFKNTKSLYARLFVSNFMKCTTYYWLTWNSTLRFFAFPSLVVLSAIGLSWP